MAVCVHCSAPLPDAARFCPSCGAATVAAPAPVEERKLATVLFADLVGSTALGGSQDPERTRAMLERFYEAMASEIESAGGTVEKFAGDAVMAAFGAPAALEDHAERALHAALAMRRRLRSTFDGELSLRTGVNTGDVVVGRPREGSSFVTGDAVNVAARLEQAAAADEILVGERTAALVRGAFELGDPRRVEAKGKENGVVGIPLLRALSLMRPRGVGGLQRAFVGRDGELELLLATYARAVEQAGPHLVTIMADAGVGKTRLMREFWDRLGGESPEPLRRTGRCLAYGQGITYWALGEILKEHLGLLESDSPEVVRERLGGREILGLALGLDTAGELHPLAARDRLHDAWVELLEELVAERPVVMLLEDLHWAEEPLLSLVERIVRDVTGPLLVIGTARPELLEASPSWGGGLRNASLVWLEPLREEHAAELVDELLAASLPDPVRRLIVARAEGNPFFVEEILGTLIDRGLLTRRNGGWESHELPAEFEIPDTVHAVVASRMDLLGTGEKAALQAAAVMGRAFWVGPLAELLDGADPDLQLLEERDFVRRRSPSTMEGETEYVFKHAVTREVAYASVPKARRARLHARFAAWLERIGGGRDELAPLLAHHYAEAARPEDVDLAWSDTPDELERLRTRAVYWLRRAAELAVGRYSLEDALALLHRALELQPEAATASELWREIGLAHALRYDGEPFWEAMQKSLAVCFDRDTCAETYSVLAFHTALRAGMWTKRPEQELVAGWIEQARELSAPESPARARALIAGAFWDKDADAAGEAVALSERLGDVELRSHAWAAMGFVVTAAGRYDEGYDWFTRRFDVLPEISDPDHRADVFAAPAWPLIGRGDFGEARRLFGEHDAVTAPLSAHHQLHGVAFTVFVEGCAGDWETVRELTPRTERAVEANLATPCTLNGSSLLCCALAHEYLGASAEADRLDEKARSLGMVGYDWAHNPYRIWLALSRGDLAAVERLLPSITRETLDCGDFTNQTARLDALAALGRRDELEHDAPAFLRPGTYLEPFAARALGGVREDEALVRQAISAFEAMRMEWHARQTRLLLAS